MKCHNDDNETIQRMAKSLKIEERENEVVPKQYYYHCNKKPEDC